MAGTFSSQLAHNDITPKRTFLVKKPVTNSSREIRDAILIDHFGFTRKDIEEWDRLHPTGFYISNNNEKTWATIKQVNSWETDINRNLSIKVPETVCKDLEEFRQGRDATEIYTAASFITDPELRSDFVESLTNIFLVNTSNMSSDPLQGTNRLISRTIGNLQSARQVSQALSYLMERAGYQDNPYLSVVKANTAITEYKMASGPGYDSIAMSNLSDATRKTNGSYIFSSGPSKISRQQASALNSHIAWLYNQIGKNEEFIERDWISRFYGVSPQKRSLLKEGDVIQLISDIKAAGTPQPRSSYAQRLDELNNEWNQTQSQQAKNDKIGSQVIPTDQRTGELFQKKTDGYDYRTFEQKKIRGPQSGYQPKFKVVHGTENPYARANVRADGVGAGLELPIKLALHLKREFYRTFGAELNSFRAS